MLREILHLKYAPHHAHDYILSIHCVTIYCTAATDCSTRYNLYLENFPHTDLFYDVSLSFDSRANIKLIADFLSEGGAALAPPWLFGLPPLEKFCFACQLIH